MFQVNVTIGFNPETLAVLSGLFSGAAKAVEPQPVMLSKEIKQIISKADRPSVSNGKAAKVEPVINGNAGEGEHEEEGGGVATEAVTVEQVRAAVVVKKQALGSDIAIKGILAELGAVDAQGKAKLPELKEKDYAAFLTRLEGLK